MKFHNIYINRHNNTYIHINIYNVYVFSLLHKCLKIFCKSVQMLSSFSVNQSVTPLHGKHLQLSNVSKRDDISNRALLCQRPLWLSKPVREEEFLKLLDRVRSWDGVDYGRLFAKMFVYFERVCRYV